MYLNSQDKIHMGIKHLMMYSQIILLKNASSLSTTTYPMHIHNDENSVKLVYVHA